jgi:predicted small lipoprotein YifL
MPARTLLAAGLRGLVSLPPLAAQAPPSATESQDLQNRAPENSEAILAKPQRGKQLSATWHILLIGNQPVTLRVETRLGELDKQIEMLDTVRRV